MKVIVYFFVLTAATLYSGVSFSKCINVRNGDKISVHGMLGYSYSAREYSISFNNRLCATGCKTDVSMLEVHTSGDYKKLNNKDVIIVGTVDLCSSGDPTIGEISAITIKKSH